MKLNITKNSQGRFNISNVEENNVSQKKGFYAYESFFGKILGIILKNFFNKAVRVQTSTGKIIYANSKSLAKYFSRTKQFNQQNIALQNNSAITTFINQCLTSIKKEKLTLKNLLKEPNDKLNELDWSVISSKVKDDFFDIRITSIPKENLLLFIDHISPKHLDLLDINQLNYVKNKITYQWISSRPEALPFFVSHLNDPNTYERYSFLTNILFNEDKDLLQSALDAGLYLETLDKNFPNSSFLHESLIESKWKLCKIVLKHGVVPLNTIELKNTWYDLSDDTLDILSASIVNNDLSKVSINTYYTGKVSLLDWAINKNNYEDVKRLAQRKVSLNPNLGKSDTSPLKKALTTLNLQAAKALIEMGANPLEEISINFNPDWSLQDIEILVSAVQAKKLNKIFLEDIADYGFNPKDAWPQILMKFIHNDNIDVVKTLIDQGFPVDISLLKKAVEHHSWKILTTLMGCNLKYPDDTIVFTPFDLKEDNIECMISLTHGNLNKIIIRNYNQDFSLLHFAVTKNCNENILKNLLQNGLKIDELDVNKQTPLMIALGAGQFQAASLLIQQGAVLTNEIILTSSINLSEQFLDQLLTYLKNLSTVKIALKNEGFSLLHLAAQNGCDENTLEKLLKNGFNINAADADGKTPLMIAFENKQSKTASLLIKHGALLLNEITLQSTINLSEQLLDQTLTCLKDKNINNIKVEKRCEGFSLMHLAAQNGCYEKTIRKLLEMGFNIDVVDANGKSPLEIAIRAKKFTTAKLLLGSGAKKIEKLDLDISDSNFSYLFEMFYEDSIIHSSHSHIKSVKELLSFCSSIHINGSDLWKYFFETHQNQSLLKFFIENGLEISAEDAMINCVSIIRNAHSKDIVSFLREKNILPIDMQKEPFSERLYSSYLGPAIYDNRLRKYTTSFSKELKQFLDVNLKNYTYDISTTYDDKEHPSETLNIQLNLKSLNNQQIDEILRDKNFNINNLFSNQLNFIFPRLQNENLQSLSTESIKKLHSDNLIKILPILNETQFLAALDKFFDKSADDFPVEQEVNLTQIQQQLLSQKREALKIKLEEKAKAEKAEREWVKQQEEARAKYEHAKAQAPKEKMTSQNVTENKNISAKRKSYLEGLQAVINDTQTSEEDKNLGRVLIEILVLVSKENRLTDYGIRFNKFDPLLKQVDQTIFLIFEIFKKHNLVDKTINGIKKTLKEIARILHPDRCIYSKNKDSFGKELFTALYNKELFEEKQIYK